MKIERRKSNEGALRYGLLGAAWVWVTLAGFPVLVEWLTELGFAHQRANVSMLGIYEIERISFTGSVFTLQELVLLWLVQSLGFQGAWIASSKERATHATLGTAMAFLVSAPVVLLSGMFSELRRLMPGLEAAPSAALSLGLLYAVASARVETGERAKRALRAGAGFIAVAGLAFVFNVGPIIDDEGDRHAALVEAFGAPYSELAAAIVESKEVAAVFGANPRVSPPSNANEPLWMNTYSDKLVLSGGVVLSGESGKGACLVNAQWDPKAQGFIENGGSITCLRLENEVALVLDLTGKHMSTMMSGSLDVALVERMHPELTEKLKAMTAGLSAAPLDTTTFPVAGASEPSMTYSAFDSGLETLWYTFSYERDGEPMRCSVTASLVPNPLVPANDSAQCDAAPLAEGDGAE